MRRSRATIHTQLGTVVLPFFARVLLDNFSLRIMRVGTLITGRVSQVSIELTEDGEIWIMDRLVAGSRHWVIGHGRIPFFIELGP